MLAILIQEGSEVNDVGARLITAVPSNGCFQSSKQNISKHSIEKRFLDDDI